MSLQFRVFAVVSLSMFAAACGDDPEKAQDKCESLVTSYCGRVVACAQDEDLLSSEFSASDLREECEEFMLDDAHCEDAVRVSDDYGSCVSQAKQLSCDDVVDALTGSQDLSERYIAPLPSDCQGAVLYSE